MPHVVVEYTANLGPGSDIPELLRKINASLTGQRTDAGPVFPVAGIRSRAVQLTDWCIADGSNDDDAFVHVAVKLAAGRSEVVKKKVFDALFAVVTEHFAAAFAARGLALSMEVNEFGEEGTWKKNNLHARLQARVAA